jgi:hypothetical protein
MSTYWYLQCLDHDPPLRSDDEVEQHTYGLPAIRVVYENRHTILEVAEWMTLDDRYARNAMQFLAGHLDCRLQFVSEYGDIEPITVDLNTGDTP